MFIDLFYGTTNLFDVISRCAGCGVPNDTEDYSTNELYQGYLNKTLRVMHANSCLCLKLLKIKCLFFVVTAIRLSSLF